MDEETRLLKEFFDRSDIRNMLREKDIYDVYYQFAITYGEDTVNILTNAFCDMNIDVLDYCEWIPSYCYYLWADIDISFKHFHLPDSISQVGVCAFSESRVQSFMCTSDSTLQELESGCFMRCESLHEIYLPKSLKTIGYRCFYKCANLTDIYYFGTKHDWGNIKIGDEAFGGCPSVRVHCQDGSFDL